MDVGGESVLPGAAPRKQKLDQKKMGTPTSGGGQQVLLAKKKTLHVQHAFLYISLRCFARLQRETSRNVLVIRFMRKSRMCSVFSCSLIFSLSLIITLVVASISHFFTAAIKCSCFSSKKIGPLCF